MLKPVKRPKSPFYIARGTINGARVERSTGETTLAGARRACERIAAEILSADPHSIQKGRLTVTQAINFYIAAGKDERFLQKIKDNLGAKLVSEIDNQTVRAAATQHYTGLSSATIRRQLFTPIKAAINYCADEGLCGPIRLKSPEDGKKRIQFFTPSQADHVIANLTKNENKFIPALVTGLFGQGMRMGEALTLDGSDVSLEHRYAILRDTKNGEERIITLTTRTIAAWSILPTLGKPGPLFRRLDGMPFRAGKKSGGQIAKAFAKAVKEAGLDPSLYTPHICRHSWATWFYSQTKDVLLLKTEGGWKSEEYQRYTKMSVPTIGREAKRHNWHFVGENRGNAIQNAGKATG